MFYHPNKWIFAFLYGILLLAVTEAVQYFVFHHRPHWVEIIVEFPVFVLAALLLHRAMKQERAQREQA